ncbi:apolipoprotein N-acyltransferase [bacterium]|nr:apolipoprotein N-acyltransferase [bacterium]
MKLENLRNLLFSEYQNILKAVLAGLLLYLAFPDKDFYLLSLIAFIPLLQISEVSSFRKIYLYSLLMGMILICASYSWLQYLAEVFVHLPFPIDYGFWFFYGFYNAQIFCLIFLTYAYFKRKTKIPDIVLFPVIVVTIWSFFPNLFYFNLANGISGFLPAIQASEFTGVFGVDFIIALVNITLFKLFQFIKKREGVKTLSVALVIIVVWFSNGYYSLNKWDKEIENWKVKKIGMIQSNRISSVTGMAQEKEDSLELPIEMEMSRKAIKEGAELLVWPEGHFRAYLNYSKVRKSYQNFVAETGIPLILHDVPVEFKDQKRVYRNSSIWIKKDGRFGGIYHKRFLVPLGEYIPFFNRFEDLIVSLELPNVTAGTKIEIFDTAGMKILPLICYEIQFSHFAARAVRDNPAGKVILTQSNDGWYGKEAQSEQHRSSNALRAVENRVPVVHIINNGRSSVVLPNGRVVYLAESWKRSAQVAHMPYSRKSGGSFFSQYTDLFLNTVRFIALLFLIHLFILWRKETS